MSAAAFRGVALFLWSRHRTTFVVCGLGYALLIVGSGSFSALGQAGLFAALISVPVVLPPLLFMDSGKAANLDLTGPEGLFPRNFFVLPLRADQLVLPFMMYAALFAAVQWLLAAVIIDRSQFDLAAGSLWFPVLGTSFVVWTLAVMWTPVRHRFARVMQLLVLLCTYLFVFVVAMSTTISSELILALSLAQFPIAYAMASRGVAKNRRGEPSQLETSAPQVTSGLPDFASPFGALRWMERRLHRWTGKSALLALIPAVLLTLVLMARLSGTSDPETLQKLGQAVIGLLFVALSAIAIATGISFGGFRYRPQFQQAEGYSMPPFFAALPVATGDLVWTKIQAVAQRMLWISAGVALMCAVIARISGFQLAALPLVSSVLLALSAAVSALWITLLGRAKVVWISFLLICFLPVFVLAGLQRTDEFVASLPVILPIAAAVKLGALALLMFHVGSRKMLDWGRLAIITAFWVATAATVMACLTFYAAMSLLNALFVGIVVAPVLGAVGAPAALAWNRAR